MFLLGTTLTILTLRDIRYFSCTGFSFNTLVARRNSTSRDGLVKGVRATICFVRCVGQVHRGTNNVHDSMYSLFFAIDHFPQLVRPSSVVNRGSDFISVR